MAAESAVPSPGPPAPAARGRDGRVPLSVLDLVPVASGSSAAQALVNTVDLAQRAEALGYRRYWFAEHHLNPGVAGTSPPILIALVAAATRSIRLGSGGMQLGHRTALAVVEEFGLLDAAYPGRIDLGLGRSAGPPPAKKPAVTDGAGSGSGDSGPVAPGSGSGAPDSGQPESGAAARAPVRVRTAAPDPDGRGQWIDGLLIPPPFDIRQLLRSPRFALHKELLTQTGAETADYGEQVADILALLAGTYRAANGAVAQIVPGEGAGAEVWVLGSSAGVSASVAGRHGLPFAANYHVAPATVLEAVDAYRAAFRPSATLDRPHVIVSADAVVAPDDDTARKLAAGYGRWVHSIRTGAGAIPYPSAADPGRPTWTDEDRRLVADRIDTQFVGSPTTVVDRLEVLRDATDADELLVTTMTHDHADRVRSYELLAAEWGTG